ncbi:MAG: hypothetical protein ACTSP9_06530 [Promethearchaeota archaeon]
MELKPLRFEHMDLLAKLDNPETRIEGMREIIKITLKEAVPDATDEEIEKLGITYLMQISNAIAKVNGLNETKKD